MHVRLGILWLVAFTVPAAAQEMKVSRDIAYSDSTSERQTLDVFSPQAGDNLPIVFWIHGGGWMKGNKTAVQGKPRAFTDQGFVFVSTNYRFVPEVSVKIMTSDIAKALRWTYDHAEEFGGDRASIVVMGHSAGAHLAALVCTDESYLKAEGMSLSNIKGCVPVDVSVYDIPKRMSDSAQAPPTAARKIFGNSQASYQELSPANHVAAGKGIPPFLILHVASRPETKEQSHWFADKLNAAGIPARVVAAEGKTHGTINTELGKEGDKPTQEIFSFLRNSKPPR